MVNIICIVKIIIHEIQRYYNYKSCKLKCFTEPCLFLTHFQSTEICFIGLFNINSVSRFNGNSFLI